MASQALFSNLRDSLQYSSVVSQEFLPVSKLNDLVTKEAVQNELPRGLISRLFSDSLPSKISMTARRIFAILVMIGEPHAIRKLVDDGLTDDDLPLARPAHDRHSGTLESKRKLEVRALKDWKNEAKVDMFLEKQWLFLAPTLDVTGTSTVFQVDPKCPLPFLRATELRGEHSNVVFKSELHAAHQTGSGAQNTDKVIAVKIFHNSDGFTLFDQEKENLLKTQSIKDRHLIRYLFFCKRDKSYFIAFPWAEGGNLQEFWMLHTSNKEYMLWSLQQMLGISGALRKLHDINFRHGDLKPGNILHFPNGGLGNLVVADVGISKVHKAATYMRSMSTLTRATTPSYEPPEAIIKTNKPRPRRYDIWSMACIYLEFVIWMVYGVNAVNSFAESREEGTSAQRTSNFYSLQGDIAVIHPAVIEAFAVLRSDPRCAGDTALGALVNLITKHLLLIQVEDRVTADTMYKKLEEIVHRATTDPSFIMNQAIPPQETPAIFGRPVEIPPGLRTATSW
ncbi:serine/threonine protein kinase [Colletotrichum scovillei]|uniref:Serine/threonine protein kinase n=1 Tax=Colletotrichum scovillei TaxID=1209932 RepID=A0A9P7UDL7_9PEZI|nr:serine/threonine protein kinase [Colletotrichum scovillei]KAF4778688.1 serine/threonine protein kinase [Colletotrichum scovillei]KAG7044217.1 serine/threonine protein kinase [Colletotrichum scovillei]KAG7046315.1 serine/threonine protein kinase [Colletotrichum scovillei]KAG7063668.1 serine/threonine protein kinase [Colletotrichum scovillei]